MGTYFLEDGTLIKIPKDVGLLTTYARDKLYNLLGIKQYVPDHQLLYKKVLEKFGHIIRIPLLKTKSPIISESPPSINCSPVPIAVFELKKVLYNGQILYTLEFIKIEE